MPLEPVEAAESDCDQQLDPLLTDGAPETTICFFFIVCVPVKAKLSSNISRPNQTAWTDL